jgi:hypothetical protein
MTVMRVKGFQIFADRHGKMRCYHRATRIAVDLAKSPIGSAEFFAECARIAELTKLSGPPKPGTLGRLISEYRASPSFLDLASRTQADYQRCLNYLKTIAQIPVVRFDRALVVRIRDKAATKHGRRFANYVKAILSILFVWGSERGYLASNPADKIKNIRRQRGASEANRPWSDEERDTVLLHAPGHMRPAIGLMMFTGLGPKDAAAPALIPRGRADFYPPFKNRRAGILASTRGTPGNSCRGAIAQRHHALCQLKRTAMDRERLSGIVAQVAHQVGAPGTSRRRPYTLRTPTHHRSDLARSGCGRAHYCRCSWAEND